MEKKLVLASFSNRLALDIGLKIVELAKERNLTIGVEVSRLNHTVFLYLDDGLSADNQNWIRRKINVVKHFENSSLAVKHDLINGNTNLSETFGLDNKDFVACGGSIPIIVKEVGLIGIVTVTGLSDVDDHQLIVDALSGDFEFIR